MWIGISLCFLVLICSIIFYLNQRNEDTSGIQTRSVTFTDAGFDTPITFQATCSEEDFQKYSDLVKKTFLGYNALFDQYHLYKGIHNVAYLNENAYENPVEVEDALIDILEDSIEANKLSEQFDVTEGKVLSLWHDARESENPEVPSEAAVILAKDHEGVGAIKIDGNTVRFTDPNLSLDLGGIAKGYTTQIVTDLLKKEGLDNGYINAGGNVELIGEKENGKDWVIGIQDPDSNGSIVQFSTKKPLSIVTSGDYQRYFEKDGVRYSHIIDPQTGYPATYMRSVSVINEDSGTADALSTAIFCMPLEEGMEFAVNNNIECIWILDADQAPKDMSPDFKTDTKYIYVTPNIKDQVALTK